MVGGGGAGRGASLLYMYLQIQWNPINTVTNGPQKFGRINGVAVLKRVFLQESAWRFLRGGQKKWP